MSNLVAPFSISLEECRRITRRAGLSRPHSVTWIPRGEVNACFDVTLCAGEHVILKVQHRPPRPEWLLRECRVYDLLLLRGLPVPWVIDLNLDRDIISRNYTLLTALPGIDGDLGFGLLPPHVQRSVFEELGCLAARLHEIPLNGEELGVPTERRWVSSRQERFASLYDAHMKAGFLPSWLLTRVRGVWERYDQYLSRAEVLCLLHGDYNLHNIKLSEGRIVGLFDLEQADLGHAEYDFAALETGILSARPDLRDQFYRSYLRLRSLEEGYEERIVLYTLQRHLEMMLAYEGPVRFPDGTGSAADTIASLVKRHVRCRVGEVLGQGGILEPPIRGEPGRVPDDPESVEAVSGAYLADIWAKGTGKEAEVRYWHRFDSPNMGFPGRSGARVVFFQIAVQVAEKPVKTQMLVLKITSSKREALFYLTLAQFLAPHVPQAYHLVQNAQDEYHWLFLEYIPCMSLGPLWQGREFGKALEGLVRIQSRFWQRSDLLGCGDWLPSVDSASLTHAFRSDLESIRNILTHKRVPDSLRPSLAALCEASARDSPQVQRMASCLEEQPSTLVHGDFHIANIGARSMDDDAAPVTADWSSCKSGPPQLDLITLCDAVHGMLRETPSRETLLDNYFEMAESNSMPITRCSFDAGLAAAAFFADFHSLPNLLSNGEWESSWRQGIAYSVSEELEMRVERSLRLIRGGLADL